LAVVAKNFPLKGAKVFDRVFLKANSTSAANRTLSTFVPLCRRVQGLIEI